MGRKIGQLDPTVELSTAILVAKENIGRFQRRSDSADNPIERKIVEASLIGERERWATLSDVMAGLTSRQASQTPITFDGEPVGTDRLAHLTTREQFLVMFVAQDTKAIAMFDHDMHYLAMSNRWKSDYRLADNLVGKSHYDVFPEISGQWKEIHRRGLRGETVKTENESFERLDGNVQSLNWVVRPWYRSKKDVGGIIICSEEVSGL